MATAGFVARGGNPFAVGIGAFAALALVSGLAALLGKTLQGRLPLALIRRIAGVICLFFAVTMALQLAGVEMPGWLPV